MKVAVSGKGGSGKTTLSGVLARLAGRWFGRALAIDGDPNPNLARALGIPHEGPWQLLPPDLLEAVEAEGGRKVRLTRSVEEILTTYGVDGPDGVKLLALGEVEAPGKGCLCSRHAIVREIVGAALQEVRDPLILDMEASLEHLRRGTVRYVDVLLVVAEPYYRSLETAGRLVRLARELGVPRILGVGNKVRTAGEEAAVLRYLEGLGVEVVGVVPFDEAVAQADAVGKALLDFYPEAPAVGAMEALAARIWRGE